MASHDRQLGVDVQFLLQVGADQLIVAAQRLWKWRLCSKRGVVFWVVINTDYDFNVISNICWSSYWMCMFLYYCRCVMYCICCIKNKQIKWDHRLLQKDWFVVSPCSLWIFLTFASATLLSSSDSLVVSSSSSRQLRKINTSQISTTTLKVKSIKNKTAI